MLVVSESVGLGMEVFLRGALSAWCPVLSLLAEPIQHFRAAILEWCSSAGWGRGNTALHCTHLVLTHTLRPCDTPDDLLRFLRSLLVHWPGSL